MAEGLPGTAILALAGLGVVAFVCVVIAAVLALLSLRRAYALQRDMGSAVPQPRQVVAPDGRTLFANEAFYEFFGHVDRPTPLLLAEEIGGDEDAREQLERLAANAASGTAGYVELRVRPRDDPQGPPEWRYVAAYPLPGRPGTVLWVVNDITLRRQMEQIIQEDHERFVDLLEYAPIGFYSVDEHGRFLFANRTLCDWLGLSYEDLDNGMIGLHDVLDTPVPADAPPYHPFAEPDATRGEVAFKDAEGGSFRASISQDLVRSDDGRVVRTRSVVRNLSRERAVAEALERSVQRFERFFVEAPVGIVLLDAEARLSEANKAFAALIGKPVAALAGHSLFDLVHEEDRERLRSALERAAQAEAGAEGPAPGPVEARLAGHTEAVCDIYVSRMTLVDGATDGFIAHFIDTTERKNLEVQFAQSQKIQAVGQLAGGIAHDFNNLLTAMIGFSDLLLLRHRPGDQSFADIMQIKQNANRAANLVRQLLAFSRQQTLQPKVLDVTDTLAELSHLLRRLIGENIELKMIHGRDLSTVRADQGQLEQVIVNLAVNARDAMAEGGTLTIRTYNTTTRHEKKRRGEVMPPGDYVVIEVSDTGCGIAKEHLDRIFDPFFSTKEVGAGTGLGLSTVYGIVKQTGGFVYVDSRVGEGATFTIYLPQYEADTAAGTAGAAEDATAKGGRDLSGMGTILLVEDEDAVRSFGARALRNKGYEVLEARSGESAMDLLRERGAEIDLLITDVVMPRIDGPTLVRHVRAHHPDLKVIFISGYTEDAFRKKLGEDEGILFLAKPFSLKQLAAKVKEVLGERAVVVTGAPAAATAADSSVSGNASGGPSRRHSTAGRDHDRGRGQEQGGGAGTRGATVLRAGPKPGG
ncbi:MAG: PAS domain-containing sensor histidine kinase [Alphaproteobacteria bacterium]|nr:MAG: PAS domain-containing sensor histidine kinase [Alphaproteobacteria bacterium]